uniref:DUF6932 family protein n=1 Tax=Vaginimicrobium propionicum TaxID=1871034 RepID=UPI000970DB6C|nr:hypothetical protein [Vaginimicrobium propionicum]
MIPPLDPSTNALPIGRYQTTLSEIEQRFANNQHRIDLLGALKVSVQAIKQLAKLHSVWLSGSYFTSKEHPNDIDVVYWYDPKPELNRFALVELMNRIREQLPIDSYPVPYAPKAGAARSKDGSYCANRGYWDDLWGRIRSEDPEIDRLCRRGYLEVIIDGYR